MVPAQVKTVAEFLAWCKANPKLAAYASPGNGSTPHFAGLALSRAAQVELTHVAYKGGAPAMNDVLGGQIAANMAVISNALPLLQTGKLRALAVTGANRSQLLPDVPTMNEAMNPGFVLDAWYGLLAPVGTPPDIIARLNSEMVKILRDPAVRGPLIDGSHEIVGSTPAEFAATIQRDFTVWGDLARKLNVKVD
jgi:tripartite-type tricarboxylate transporter receptor subunit TctC